MQGFREEGAVSTLATALPGAGKSARHPGPQLSGSGSLSISAALDPSTLPSRTPACMHGEEERHTRHFNSGGDEASFMSGVPHHTPPDLAVWSLLSHTPTPVGSLVKSGDYRTG
ncbi:hypothetical protein M9458_008846, partial [Cirrhinus mrigala]